MSQAGNEGDLLIEEEMKDSYLTYAMSVIVSRALPDVRDGLKPSQRRILVAMRDLNLSPTARRAKCAAIVGETMKTYHPHGDMAIYPTLVRLGQDWSTRYPLIDPQGNFGSQDGDSAAAMRYTEARLAPPAGYLLEDLDKDTVELGRNYDDSTDEPVVLPGRFPGLICNGSTGIAVGMATSIPPHNLREVADGIIHLLDHPDCAVADLMKVIPGPDFPTGGLICGREGIKQAYETGRGRLVVRARIHAEDLKKEKKQLVVTEIPYQIATQDIINRIVDAVKNDHLPGVSDVRDESDREGMRLVIELKRGEDEQVTLNQLFKHTQLQDTYGVNLLAIVDKRPKTLNLKELLCAYRDFRIEVIRRRTRFLLDRAEKRHHIVDGLLKALVDIDAIIQTIKSSQTVPEARANLQANFDLTEPQASAILEMKLARLTGLERLELESEKKKLEEEIAGFRELLAKEALVLDVIREDLFELKEKFGDVRRTEITGNVQEIGTEQLIAEEDMVVTMSHKGYLKRVPLAAYRAQGRGGKGITAGDAKEGDFTERLFVATTHDYILFFTNRGQVHWLKVYDIPQLSRAALGRAVVNMLTLEEGETIQSMIPVRQFDDRQLVFATRNGTVKRTKLEDFSRPKKGGIRAITLDEGDSLVAVCVSSGSQEVVIGTAEGMAIRFPESDIRSMGRSAVGVRGIKLEEGDFVVGACVVSPATALLSVCENGFGKRTPIEEYRLQGRGGMGVINIRANERNGKVVALLEVVDGDEIMLMTQDGMVVRTPVDALRTIGRATQGVKLIKIAENDRVVSVARVAREEGAEGELPFGVEPPSPPLMMDEPEGGGTVGGDGGPSSTDGGGEEEGDDTP